MTATKRVTVHLEAPLHRALRLKSAETDVSISGLVNDAVRHSLAEDADDLAAFRDRVKAPRVPFEAVVRDLKKRGKLEHLSRLGLRQNLEQKRDSF